MPGQTSYNLDPDIAVPGMYGDQNLDSFVRSYPAGEVIPFGRLCEVDSTGKLFLVKGASSNIALNKLAGVSVIDNTREQGLSTTGSTGGAQYQIGEMVPVMRRGRCYAAWDNGGTQGVMDTINVNHPSTTDPNGIRGVFTKTATSTVAGSEIAACPNTILSVKNVAALTPRRGAATANNYTYVCLLELNLPGT